jgi:hypothetical protein
MFGSAAVAAGAANPSEKIAIIAAKVAGIASHVFLRDAGALVGDPAASRFSISIFIILIPCGYCS